MTSIVCVGLGVIGQDVVRTVVGRGGLRLVGVVDIGVNFRGRRLDAIMPDIVADAGALIVNDNLGAAFDLTAPDVVLLSTSSRFHEIAMQVTVALEHRASVISTCEELSYPWNKEGASQLHDAAIGAGRTVLGTGVNPGFVMDSLPAMLSLACAEVRSISVSRVVNLSRRRAALQRKAGVGISPDAFATLASQGAIGHVGLDCSAQLLAIAVGLEPPDAPSVELAALTGADGLVCGFEQSVLIEAGGKRVELSLTMSTAPEIRESDRIFADGSPPISVEIEGGVFGDTATAAVVVNSIPSVLAGPPGLKTVLDLAPVHYWSGVR